MTLQPLCAAALCRRSAAFFLAALLVLYLGATVAAQHAHGEDDEHCSVCAIFGTDDGCAPTPTAQQSFAASTAPVCTLGQHSPRTPLHAYGARAPPLSR